MDDGEFHLLDLVVKSDDSYKCLRCGIIFLSTNPDHVQQHYTNIHKRLFRLPADQQRLKDIREDMLKKKTKKRKKKYSKKSPAVPMRSDPGDEYFLRPITEMFHVLQSTFLLLRPHTKQEVMKQLTTTALDAYYGDQENINVVPT